MLILTVNTKITNKLKKEVFVEENKKEEREKREVAEEIAQTRKKMDTPIFERAMKAALRAKNWLAMEVIVRAFNETDSSVWGLNGASFIGTTEYLVDKIAQEKGLSEKEKFSLRRDLVKYES